MYTGHSFNKWGIGDVDVIKVNDVYHLFHLVLPNHAYIAHAVSTDGLHWKRVQNALFIGHPGAWDDGMLWTMHVSADPDKPGSWRMFYTGLTRQERGRIQRIGLAESDDLFTWRKVNDGTYPLAVEGPHYEASIDEGRSWVSFRDPFFFHDGDRRWLLAAGRVNTGPIVHRGCVTLATEVGRNCFSFKHPLYFPARYDDMEVPSLVAIKNRYYLIASIREDIKVHYWWAESPEGPFQNHSDNVLLPKGNYAARICPDNGRVLIWNFFSPADAQKGMNNMLPPPKELEVDDNDHLVMRSFHGFDALVESHLAWPSLSPMTPLMGNPTAKLKRYAFGSTCGTDSGFEVFCLIGTYKDFRMRGELTLRDNGKCGFAFHLDDDASGYYISLDPFKGIVSIRAWGANPSGGIEEAFVYKTLQRANFVPTNQWPMHFELVAFGKYLELSLNGAVHISLGDETYRSGHVGFYTESGELALDNVTLEPLRSPLDEACDPVTQTALPEDPTERRWK